MTGLKIIEKDFQGFVVSLAGFTGWAIYHTYDSRKSTAGFPDLVMLRGNEMIVAELKSEAGKVTPPQQKWLDAFKAVHIIEVAVWRPSDQKALTERLQRKAGW